MALQIITESIPTMFSDQPLDMNIVAVEGTLPYAFSLIFGSLPSSLTLNPATGQLSGTPLGSEIGSYTITVRVTDGAPAIYDKSYTFRIKPGKFQTTQDWLLDAIYRLLNNSYPLDYYKHDVMTKLFHYSTGGSSPGMFNASAIIVNNWTGYWPHTPSTTEILPTVLSELSTPEAVNVEVDASGFSGNLAPTDTDVQKVADAFDIYVPPPPAISGGFSEFTCIVDGVAAIPNTYLTLKDATDAGHRGVLIVANVTEIASNAVTGTTPLYVRGSGGVTIDFASFEIALPSGSHFEYIGLRANLVAGTPTMSMTGLGVIPTPYLFMDTIYFQISNGAPPASNAYFIDGVTCVPQFLNNYLYYTADIVNATLININSPYGRINGLYIEDLSAGGGTTLQAVQVSAVGVFLTHFLSSDTSPKMVDLLGVVTGLRVEDFDGVNITMDTVGGSEFSLLKNLDIVATGALVGNHWTSCIFNNYTDISGSSNGFSECEFTAALTYINCDETQLDNCRASHATAVFILSGAGSHQISNFISTFDFVLDADHCQLANVTAINAFSITSAKHHNVMTNVKAGTNFLGTITINTLATYNVFIAPKHPTVLPIVDNSPAGLSGTQFIAVTSF